MAPCRISDVKKHLSTHDQNGRSLFRSSNSPDATAVSVEELKYAEAATLRDESSQNAISLEYPDGPTLVLAAAAPKSVSD